MKFLFALLAIVAVVKAQTQVGYCRLVGTANDSGITGDVWFVQNDGSGNVTVNATIRGITNRQGLTHGFHVHNFGNISDTTAAEAVGSHFGGAGGSVHGCPSSGVRHEGDMGNVQVNADGTVNFLGSFDLQTLVGTDANSIIGHGLVFHNLTDDCVSTTSSGARLAQCVIGIANPADIPPAYIVTGSPNTAGNQAQTSNRLFCFLQATNGNPAITGYVDFQGVTGGVQVSAIISGLTNTNIAYGLHIHQYGDLFGNTGTALGGHYNPYESPIHGIPPNTSRHLGDLGNVCGYTTSTTGVNTFYYQYTNTNLTIGGIYSIVGRGVALHNQTDYQGATAYGPRVGHCVIGVANATIAAVPSYSDYFTNLVSADCSGPVVLTAAPTAAPSPSTTPTTAPTTTPPSPSTTPTTTPTTAPTTKPTSAASSVMMPAFAALVSAAVLLM